jgi:hypothetical protein
MGKVNLATRRLHLSSWRTVDYVLVVATAAVYGAALLTLAHVKLVPGTNLRPRQCSASSLWDPIRNTGVLGCCPRKCHE